MIRRGLGLTVRSSVYQGRTGREAELHGPQLRASPLLLSLFLGRRTGNGRRAHLFQNSAHPGDFGVQRFDTACLRFMGDFGDDTAERTVRHGRDLNPGRQASILGATEVPGHSAASTALSPSAIGVTRRPRSLAAAALSSGQSWRKISTAPRVMSGGRFAIAA